MRIALAVTTVLAAALSSACYDDGHPQAGVCVFDAAEAVPNEGWTHVKTQEELVYEHNPPASGPHFIQWASYAIHTEVVNRGNWVHNLEHGGIVLLMGPDATTDERQLMLDAYTAIPDDPNCGHRRAVLTDDPLLDVHVAAVAANFVLEAPADGALTVDQITAFALACRDHAPEDICY